MRALKFVFAAILLIAIIGGAFFSYVLLAPVTANNVRFRLTSVCAMGTAALRLNDAAAIELEKLNKGSCGCLSSRILDEAGPEVAAKMTEAARKLGIFGIKRKWNKGADEAPQNGGLLESSGVKDRIIVEFSERYVKAANACEAEAA
jgi:hypothetical protein